MSSSQLRDDHKPSSAEVFLDTSIHCCWFKGEDVVKRLRRVLSLFRWAGTSTYTKLEYGQVILSQAGYFLGKLRELGSLDRLLYHVSNGLPAQQQSKKVWGFNLLTHHFGRDDAEVTERARLFLQTLMGMGTSFVDKKVDGPLEDGTGCYFAKGRVVEKSNGTLTWKPPDCKPQVRRCVVDEFFIRNRSTFVAIKAVIDDLPAERKTAQLRGFSEVIAEAEEDPSCLLSYRNGCRRLADAIIAVDGRNYGSMFS